MIPKKVKGNIGLIIKDISMLLKTISTLLHSYPMMVVH